MHKDPANPTRRMIGRRVKDLRLAKGMKLIDLARESGVQIATLSRIEHLKMTGTLDSHMRIAAALGVDLTELYREIGRSASPPKVTIRKRHTESFLYNDKASCDILTTNVLDKKMLPVLLRLEPGSRTNTEQAPSGTERFLFVLKGRIEARIDEQPHPLPAGATLYFDASQPHYFMNTGRSEARALSVTTPAVL